MQDWLTCYLLVCFAFQTVSQRYLVQRQWPILIWATSIFTSETTLLLSIDKSVWRLVAQEYNGSANITGHGGPEGKQRYISTLSQPRRWMGVGGQRHAPAALPAGKIRYALYRRLGGPQSRSGWVRKISTPPGFDPRTVQPVESRYIDWAIPACSGYTRGWISSTNEKNGEQRWGCQLYMLLGVEWPGDCERGNGNSMERFL
jgi:hypothetical protein